MPSLENYDMKTTTIALLGILVSASPALAVESTSKAPVQITSCVVARDESKSNTLPGPTYTNGVTAVVVNTTTKTIADMTISGIYNGVTVTDTIKGPFGPGSSTTLHKAHTPMIYSGPDAACVLNHVTYADGTAWQMAMPPMMKH
ncbi:MAG: hypothetical protein IAI49_02265 [Candidatus Eremiobacteraeota bacterium]|nr:hypothetical protein [Candidatus Eremiobacteraeota bacterium]